MNDEAARQGRPANPGAVAQHDTNGLGLADTSRVWRALMLAPSLEVCLALLRGEEVPLERLDVEWAQRFGLRRRAA